MPAPTSQAMEEYIQSPHKSYKETFKPNPNHMAKTISLT